MYTGSHPNSLNLIQQYIMNVGYVQLSDVSRFDTGTINSAIGRGEDKGNEKESAAGEDQYARRVQFVKELYNA